MADLEIWKGVFSGECSEQRREVLICLPREAQKKNFPINFSVAWMGCRSTFVLYTALPLLSGFRAIRDRLHDSRNTLLLSTWINSVPIKCTKLNVYIPT